MFRKRGLPEIVVEYVNRPKKGPKLLSTPEVMRVEATLRNRLRHPRSKVITDAEILKSEQRLLNRQLARAVMDS